MGTATAPVYHPSSGAGSPRSRPRQTGRPPWGSQASTHAQPCSRQSGAREGVRAEDARQGRRGHPTRVPESVSSGPPTPMLADSGIWSREAHVSREREGKDGALRRLRDACVPPCPAASLPQAPRGPNDLFLRGEGERSLVRVGCGSLPRAPPSPGASTAAGECTRGPWFCEGARPARPGQPALPAPGGEGGCVCPAQRGGRRAQLTAQRELSAATPRRSAGLSHAHGWRSD